MVSRSRHLFAWIAPLALLIPSCGSSLHQVTASEFIELASRERTPRYAATYVGYSRNWERERARVYLEVWSMGVMNPSGTDVYWTPLAEFSAEIADGVLAGDDPFTGRESSAAEAPASEGAERD